jgi:hypothetical protein
MVARSTATEQSATGASRTRRALRCSRPEERQVIPGYVESPHPEWPHGGKADASVGGFRRVFAGRADKTRPKVGVHRRVIAW